jgi:SAM-dependent MidA family methyltransferase
VQTITAWLLHNYETILKKPGKVALIELGPGRGTFLKQILNSLKMIPEGGALLKSAQLHLVEISPDLREEQFRTLECCNAVRGSKVCCFQFGPTDARMPRCSRST